MKALYISFRFMHFYKEIWTYTTSYSNLCFLLEKYENKLVFLQIHAFLFRNIIKRYTSFRFRPLYLKHENKINFRFMHFDIEIWKKTHFLQIYAFLFRYMKKATFSCIIHILYLEAFKKLNFPHFEFLFRYIKISNILIRFIHFS